jgi:TRAP-type mannitol/chloroaromatic compound transport system substrate-binding protein
MSEGRYRLVLVADQGNGFAAVRAGDADLYHASEHEHLEAHRALAYFAGLPGDRGVPARHLVAWMLVGGGQSLWDELAGDFGIKGLLAGHCGEQAAFLATRRIDAMSELAGQKAAVRGLARDVVRGLGLEPADLAATDLAAAMAQGHILAAEWGGALTTHALGLPAVAPFSVGASINTHGSALALGMRRTFWDGLGPSGQAIFTAAAAAETQLALAEDEAHRRLLSRGPAKPLWPLAEELRRAIPRVADAVVAHVAAADAQAHRINASFMAFRAMVLGEAASVEAGNV